MYSSAFPSGNGAAQTQQRKLFLSVGSSLNVPRAGLAWGITVTSSRVCGGEAPPAQGSHSTAPSAPAPAGEPQTFGGLLCVGASGSRHDIPQGAHIPQGATHGQNPFEVKCAAQAPTERRNLASDRRMDGKLPCPSKLGSTQDFSKCIFSPKV